MVNLIQQKALQLKDVENAVFGILNDEEKALVVYHIEKLKSYLIEHGETAVLAFSVVGARLALQAEEENWVGDQHG